MSTSDKRTPSTDSPGELLVAWQNYKACSSEELNLQEGDVVELLDTVDPAGPTLKRRKLNPELDIEGEKPLDTTAAQHRLAVRPRRTHTSSRHSPTRSNLNARWLVRKMQGDKRKGWVPCQVLQSIDEPTPSSGLPGDAAFRRQAVVHELVETEQEFVKDLDYVVQNYLINAERDPKKIPKVVRDSFSDVFGSLKEIAEFHRVVLMEGVKYYANEPALLGRAFLRLERDFDKHVNYCKEEPIAQACFDASAQARDYFEELSHRLGDDKTISEHLKLPIQRINDYQLLLKELVRYSACLGEENSDLQKALELMLSVPHRAQDDKFTSSIEGYRGSIHKLGRLLAHDWFSVNIGEFIKERYLFLFKARILVCKVRRISEDRSVFQLKDIIRLPQVDVKDHPEDGSTFELIERTTGQSLILTTHRQHVKEFWLKEIREFAGEADESGSDDLQVASEPTSPPTEPVQLEKPAPKVEDSPKTNPKVEEPPAKVPKIEQPSPKVEEKPKKVEELPKSVAKVEESSKSTPPKATQPSSNPAGKVDTKQVAANPKAEELKPGPVTVEQLSKVEKVISKPAETKLVNPKPQDNPKSVNPTQDNPKLQDKPKSVNPTPDNPKPQDNPKSVNPTSDNPKPQGSPKPNNPTPQHNPKPDNPNSENPKQNNPKADNPTPHQHPNPGNPKIEERVAVATSKTSQVTEIKSASSSTFEAQQIQSVTVETKSKSQATIVGKEQKAITASSHHADEVDHLLIGIKVGLKTDGLEVDDDMSKKYTEYTTSSSARSGQSLCVLQCNVLLTAVLF